MSIQDVSLHAVQCDIQQHLVNPLTSLAHEIPLTKRGETMRIQGAPLTTNPDDGWAYVVGHTETALWEAARIEVAARHGIRITGTQDRSHYISDISNARSPIFANFKHDKNFWQHKTVLVTGASSGIGKAAVDILVAEGAKVLAVARRADKLNDLAKTSPGNIIPLPADVGVPGAIDQALVAAGVTSMFAALHCAGTAYAHPLDHSDPDQIAELMRINVLGTVLFAKAALSRVENGGRIAIVSSGAAVAPWLWLMGSVSYATAKTAQYAVAQALRNECAPRGITSTAVLLGGTNTEIWDHSGDRLSSVIHSLSGTMLRSLVMTSPETAARHMLRQIENESAVASPGAGGPLFMNSTAHRASRKILDGLID